MARKGTHQARHNRTSKKGKIFEAGKSGVMSWLKISKKGSAKDKLDDYITNVGWELSVGGHIPVTVHELFHYLKKDPQFYKLQGRSIRRLEDRRFVYEHDNTVPLIRQSMDRAGWRSAGIKGRDW